MTSFSIGLTGKKLLLLGMDDSAKVTSAAEKQLSFDFFDENIYTKEADRFVPEFRDLVMPFIGNSDPIKLKTGVVIDSAMAFMNVIPIDFAEVGDTLESHIQWELSNYFQESSRDLSKRFYRLGEPLFGDSIYESLIIAIDKKKIRFVKDLLAGSGLSIRKIEIEQFAVEKCVTELFGRSVREGRVAVSRCTKERISSSVLEKGVLKHFVQEKVIENNPVQILYEQLKNILMRYDSINEVFLFGDMSSTAIENGLSKHLDGIKITHLDLFATGTSVSGKVGDTSIYAPLVGLALKNLVS